MFFCLCFEKQNINSVLSGGGWISHPPPKLVALTEIILFLEDTLGPEPPTFPIQLLLSWN